MGRGCFKFAAQSWFSFSAPPKCGLPSQSAWQATTVLKMWEQLGSYYDCWLSLGIFVLSNYPSSLHTLLPERFARVLTLAPLWVTVYLQTCRLLFPPRAFIPTKTFNRLHKMAGAGASSLCLYAWNCSSRMSCIWRVERLHNGRLSVRRMNPLCRGSAQWSGGGGYVS